MKKKSILIISILLLIILLTGCATAVEVNIADEPSGFWSGLWHGFIATITFFGSLIWDDVAIYDINNTGGWYDFGFLLGVVAFAGGSTRRRS